jgi:ABC transporter substrate binding protein
MLSPLGRESGDEAARFYHSAWHHSRCVAACCTCAAADDAGDWVSRQQITRGGSESAAGVSPRPARDWLCRRRECCDRIPFCRTKRLELLRQLLARADGIAVLVNPAEPGRTESTIAAAEATGRTMGLQIQVIKADTSRQIETAFENMEHARPDALFIGTSPFLNARNVQLAMSAAFHRLPGIHSEREYAEAGGLISYGANIADAFHQMGVYTGRILKGTKLAELPVVQSSKLELVINAATARMLGITVPASLLAVTDEVIE